MVRWGWILASVIGLGLLWGAGENLTAQTGAERSDKLRLFFDCKAPVRTCFSRDGLDFFRREIPWADWVLDREDSDVHLLVTAQEAGAGFSFQFAFIGLGSFEGQENTLRAFSSGTDTEDERRTTMASQMKLGLAPYAAQTSVAEMLSVVYEGPEIEEGATVEKTIENDPWNLWVFNVRLSGFMSGEESFNNSSVSTGLSANRVSDSWKFTSGVTFNYRENEFEVSDGETLVSFTRSMGANFLLVKSLGPHLGLGGRGEISSSTFQNQDLRLSLVPAIEFNIFPYSESSRRTFTFQYRLGPEFVRYDNETIFNKTEEWLFTNSLSATLGLTQPWGSASLSLVGTTLLNDPPKNSLTSFGNINLRITRGLSLNLGGSASRIRNRINLPKSEATDEDILLRKIILDSSFSFRFNVGLSYRFGSIFNNIVNPRFASGFFF